MKVKLYAQTESELLWIRRYVALILAEGVIFLPRSFFCLDTYHMNAHDTFYPDYDLDVERAIGIFNARQDFTEQEFIDSCQTLVDSGVWLMDKIIGETCLFLLENGSLFLPEEDQISPDGEYVILGTSRKNTIN